MKILMVAPTPFCADRGCHVRILGEVRGLRALGHQVLLCTYPLGRDVPGVRTVRTWPVPWYRKLSAGPSWHKYYIDVMLAGLVRRCLGRWKPDLVHAHLHEGACVAALALGSARVPLVLDCQGSLSEEVVAHGFTKPGTPHYRALRRIERWIDHRADAIVTSAGASAAVLREQFLVPAERIHTVLDGVDVQRFQPGRNGHAVRERFGIPPGRPLIVYTGLLSGHQGIDVLLEALRVLDRRRQEFHALIVGYPDVEQYRARAAALGVDGRTTFTGRVPFETIPALLAASDLGVSAKLPGSEGNLKLYGYLSAGLPVVAFDTPTNREIVADAGVLVGAVSASGFAEGLGSVLQSPHRWPALSARARARAVSRFSWQAAAERLVRVYHRVRQSTP